MSTIEQPTPEKTGKTNYLLIGLAVVAALAAGTIYAYSGLGVTPVQAAKAEADADVNELMKPGPLPDIVLGKADAPNVIVEYASMTCPHCAEFDKVTLPEVKKKYIDTGQARLILREFPLDNLAVAAFMLARCAGQDRYYAMVDALFQTQDNWAVEGGQAKERLLQMAREAGMSKEAFDKCLADKDLFQKIVDVRQRAHDVFQVDSTPTFFVNGKRMKGEHEVKDFDGALASSKPAAAPAAGTTPPKT